MVGGGLVTPGPPTTTFAVEFDEDMNMGLIPAAGSFTCLRDGVPIVCSPTIWVGRSVLLFEYTGLVPVTSGSIQLDVEDPNLRSEVGLTAKPVQFLVWFP